MKAKHKPIFQALSFTMLLSLCMATCYLISSIAINAYNMSIENLLTYVYMFTALFCMIPLIYYLKKRWKISFDNKLFIPKWYIVILVVIFSLSVEIINITLLDSVINVSALLNGLLNTIEISTPIIDSALAIRVIYAILITPIIEELFFRGVILEFLRRHYSFSHSLLLSAFLFALVHFNLEAFLSLFVTGLIFGFIYLSTNSLSLCILSHLVINLLLEVIELPQVHISEIGIQQVLLTLICTILTLIFFSILKSYSTKYAKKNR